MKSRFMFGCAPFYFILCLIQIQTRPEEGGFFILDMHKENDT